MKKRLLTSLAVFSIATSFCQAQSPIFYGMTITGGSYYEGTIISFNPNTNSESVVWNFAGKPSNGAVPYGNLVFDANDESFYGMTDAGGSNGFGTIINFNPSDNSENVVWNFGSGTDGRFPTGDLIYDANNGLFYGTTFQGGRNDSGAIISFNPNTNKDSVVWNFAGSPSDGSIPEGNLVYNANTGLFYAMTSGGGNTGHGTIIIFNPITNKDSVVWNLGSGTDGELPYGSLVYDGGNRLFYGMTYGGGSKGWGAIISFNPVNDSESVAWSFGSRMDDGAYPYGNLVYDASNELFYGMTWRGGSNGKYAALGEGEGAIISFNPSNNKDSLVWNFGSGTDGAYPFGNLVYDTSNGLFYGMTDEGGIHDTVNGGDGTIISFNPTNNSENVIWSFGDGTDGQSPNGSFISYSGPTGVNIINSLSESINIYPNPTSGQFTIKLNGNQNGYTVDVYNLMGEKILSCPLTPEGGAPALSAHNGSNTLQIDLSKFSSGLYFVYLKSEEGVEVGKVIVTK